MKKILSIIAVILTATILSGSGNKATVWKYELPLSFYGEFDSIPTINQFGQVRNGIIVDNIISVYNADPNGVDLTNTQIEAFRMLVGGMYTTGTWQKCKAIYPFIGGSEYKHKWNIKDLRDLDAAFRLAFPNGMTHSANGIQGNGTSQYAETFLTPSTTLSLNSVHLSCYINQGSPQQAFEIGASTSTSNIIALITSWTDSKIYGAINTNSYTISNNTFSPRGYTLVNAILNPIKLFKNGNIVQSNSLSPSTTLTTNSILLLALNSGITISQYSSKRMSFASIGSGLTDTEAIRQSNIVTQVQRHLNRQ